MADVAGYRLRLSPVALFGAFPLVGLVVKFYGHVNTRPVILGFIGAVSLQDVFGPGFFCQEITRMNLSTMNAGQEAADADGQCFEQRSLPFPVFTDDQIEPLFKRELAIFNSFEIMDDDSLDVHVFTPFTALNTRLCRKGRL